MEHVQFHGPQDGSSEACWDSMEGSETMEDDLVVTEAGPPAVPLSYPPLEATPDILTHTFSLEENFESSNDSSHQSETTSGGVSEENGLFPLTLQHGNKAGHDIQIIGQQQNIRLKTKRKRTKHTYSTCSTPLVSETRKQKSVEEGTGLQNSAISVREKDEMNSQIMQKANQDIDHCKLQQDHSSGDGSFSRRLAATQEKRQQQGDTDKNSPQLDTAAKGDQRQRAAPSSPQEEVDRNSQSPFSFLPLYQADTADAEEGLETLCLCKFPI